MPKRLTTDLKWEKPWFRKLEPRLKCFWDYLYTKCDIAGIIEIDFDTASHYIGAKIKPEDIEKMNGNVIKLKCGKYLLVNFVEFQGYYKSPKILPKIEKILIKYGIKYPIDRVSVLSDTPIDIDKEVVLDKDGDYKGKIAWRMDFNIYKQEELAAYKRITNDQTWIDGQQKYHPNMDIRLSLEKGHLQYWSTEAGWKKRKTGKTMVIDWDATFRNSLDINKVYKDKSKPVSQGFVS